MRAFSVLTGTIVFLYSVGILLVPEASAQTLAVTASVPPFRVIVVDKNSVIQTVFSNTKEPVRSVVVLEVLEGPSVLYSKSIKKQYESLESSLDFSKSFGIVYKRDDGLISGLYRQVAILLKGVLGE